MKIKKLLISFLFVLTLFCCICPIKVYAEDNDIYLGGYPAGFCLYTRGAYVIGLCDVVGKDEISSPSKGILEIGDVILNIDGDEVNNAKDIQNKIKNKSSVLLTIKRKENLIYKDVKTAEDVNSEKKLGVFIRDTVNGVGTVTFIKGNKIASLGHPVIGECGEVLDIVGGNLYDCSITGCNKSERGAPGELKGVFLKGNSTAKILNNQISGVYGEISSQSLKNNLKKVEVGTPEIGDAKMICTIFGEEPVEYDISIIKTTNFLEKDSKNLVIKINDKNLLSITGGIVQGMSGSPIIQNGKLVGAVTHVFINDPTRGYGIHIDNMLNGL